MSDWGGSGDAFDVVLVGGSRDWAEAVAIAGGRVVSRSGWGDVIDADPGALLVVDCGGSIVPADLDAIVDRADLVCCDWDQLDAVAGALLLTDAQLLCAPTPAERVEALLIAASALALPEGVREGDSVRLRRFSVEVGRIAGTLARLAADHASADVAERRPAYDSGPALLTATVDPPAIRRALRARRLRATMLGDGLFEDPAWDMLLDLFAAELEGTPVSVSSLCIAAAVAPTTALRWIGRLTDAGLFERRPDPQDKRRAFMALTPRGSAAMRGYVAALERAGLVLA